MSKGWLPILLLLLLLLPVGVAHTHAKRPAALGGCTTIVEAGDRVVSPGQGGVVVVLVLLVLLVLLVVLLLLLGQ